jgi:hypothetical protein
MYWYEKECLQSVHHGKEGTESFVWYTLYQQYSVKEDKEQWKNTGYHI